ncbi:hypothetical protein WA026_020879 [Henosepilachna vigintioctopunctata]|uniref:Uncharacterized protein n=1 Tax=Henosepilachna vigintioctopunctata TaxID=420089 RepID=A0AAW1UIK7_9CUCU
MKSAEEWFLTNGLQINKTKTNYLLFKTKHPNLKVESWSCESCSELKWVDYTKFLGLYVDNTLSWAIHIEDLCRKLSKACFALRNLRNYLKLSLLLMVYHANFESHLRLGIIAWGCNSDLEKIFIIQKRAIRIMLKMPPRDSCRGCFRSLNILTAAALYIWEVVIYLRKYPQIAIKYKYKHHYGTRSKHYILPKHHLSMYENSPLYAAILFYNKMTDELKMLNVDTFKRAFKSYLINMEPYTVDEYLNFPM